MKNILSAALALPLILLAGAMAWLAYSIQGVTRELPAVMTRVDDVNARIDAIVETIPLITEALPPIVEEVGNVRETVPPILSEVEKVRELIPQILDEVGNVREAVPPILARVDAIQEQVRELEKELPLISETVNNATSGVEATLPVIEKVLVESQAIRAEVPTTLDRVEAIVDDAHELVSKASQGAVTGVVKGVITSPFQLLKDAGKSISASLFSTSELSADDEKHMAEATSRLLHDLELRSAMWSNPKSDNQGTVSLQRAFKDDGTSCVALRFDVTLKSGKKETADKNFCLTEEGSWQMR